MLILERPWTRQPQGVVNPPPSAVFAWIGGNQTEFARGIQPSIRTATEATNVQGRAIYTSGGTNVASINHYGFPATAFGSVFGTGKPTTLLLQLRGINISSGLGIVAGLGRPSLSTCLFYIQATTAGNFVFGAHNGGFTTASWSGAGLGNSATTLAITHDGGSTLRLVHGGRDYGTQTFASTAFPTNVSAESVQIGAGYVSGANNNLWGCEAEYAGMMVLNEMLPASKLAQITASNQGIWSLFQPRRIYIPTAAATGYTHPTLSLATATEITATTAKPRVTYTFA